MKSLPTLGSDSIAAFWSRVTKTPGCWIWNGGGRVRLPDGRKARPARLAYVIANIFVPENQRVMNRTSCHEKCVRPSHLRRGGIFKITDEFSDLPVSRERKRQLRKLKAGLCLKSNCKLKLATANHCKLHAIVEREVARKKMNCVRRNDSLTYRL